MDSKPVVSILMNCFNGEIFLHDALSSVLNQTFQDWELIFFDNASTDSSKAIFDTYSDKRFKYFRADKNTILPEARNAALKFASGEWIAILDVDDYWHIGKLEKQIQCISQDKGKRADLIFTSCEVFRQKTKYRVHPIFSQETVFDDLLEIKLSVPWSSVMFRKEIFNKLIGFDCTFPSAHDLDFLIKCSRLGRFLFLDHCLTFIRDHSKNLTKSNKNSGRYFQEIIDVLKPYQEHSSASLGASKMKLLYIFGLLKRARIRLLIKEFLSISFFEYKLFLTLAIKKFF